jgi:hypothetical protein
MRKINEHQKFFVGAIDPLGLHGVTGNGVLGAYVYDP